MNAPITLDSILPLAPFTAAKDSAAAWRGRCVDIFAGCEAAVTRTLITLAAVETRGAAIRLPHLVGQRFEALASAVGSGGAFATEGTYVLHALADFRRHDPLRTRLTHGTFSVTIDQRGQWHLVIRVHSLRGGRATEDVLATDEREAASTLAAIEKDGSRLRSALGQLRSMCSPSAHI